MATSGEFGCPDSVFSSVQQKCNTVYSAFPTCTQSADPACCSSFKSFATEQVKCYSSYATCLDFAGATAFIANQPCSSFFLTDGGSSPMTATDTRVATTAAAESTPSTTPAVTTAPATTAPATTAPATTAPATTAAAASTTSTKNAAAGRKANVKVYAAVALVSALFFLNM